MDFYAILDQVVALLRHRQRVTYRALKRQFALDDDALADLTAELLYAHPHVRDDAGQGLLWTGEPAPATAPVEPPLQAIYMKLRVDSLHQCDGFVLFCQTFSEDLSRGVSFS